MKVKIIESESLDPTGKPIFWANVFFDGKPKASLPFHNSADRNEFIQELMVGLAPGKK